MHYTFVHHLDPIVVEDPLVMLRLEDRTPIEVEWQVPLARLGLFRPWFINGNG
jgi:hypothetical protein